MAAALPLTLGSAERARQPDTGGTPAATDHAMRWWPRPVPGMYEFELRGMATTALAEIAIISCLGIPPIARMTGVGFSFLALILAIHVACMTVLGLLAVASRTRPRLLSVQLPFALTYNIALCLWIIAHSGDAKTSWWMAYVMYAGITGSLQELDAAWLIAAIFAVCPFAAVPALHSAGADLSEAIARASVAGGMAVLGYLVPARVGIIWRQSRDEQRRDLAAAHQRTVELEAAAYRAERQALSRDLHDAVGSRLAVVALYSDLLQAGVANGAMNAELAATLRQSAKDGLADLRLVINGLHPEVASWQGVKAQLQQLAQQAAAAGAQTQLDIDAGEVPLPQLAALACVRTSQEAVANALRHGKPSKLTLAAHCHGGALTLTVADDGSGFDPAQPCAGMGLANMRERARLVGGQIDVTSQIGTGTVVALSVPVAADGP